MTTKRLVSFILSVVIILCSFFSLKAFSVNDINDVLGVFEGTYTAYQGETSLTLSIHKKDELLADESLLKKYADVATECSKNHDGVPSKVFTSDEIRTVVEAHPTDLIAFYNFYPTVGNPNVEEGLYTMTVEYDTATNTYDFVGYEWIQRHTYVFAHLINVELKDDTITGNVYINSNGTGDCGDVLIYRANGKSTYRVEFENRNVSVNVNEQVKVNVIVKDEYMQPAELFTAINWVSDNPKIAIIEGENWTSSGASTSAIITGVSPGVTTVHAVIENQRIAECRVVVSDNGLVMPPELFLEYELTDELEKYKVDETTTEYVYKPQYTISATAYNSSNLNISNVELTLNMPSNMNLKADSSAQTVSLGSLAPNESKTATWKVSVDVDITGYHSVRYSVSLKDTSSLGIVKFQTIFINPFVPEDNTVNIGIDTWSFYNTSTYFPNGYKIDDSLYAPLTETVTNIEQERIDKYIIRDWKGSCFGMSSIVALNKIERFDIDSLDNDAERIYDLSSENEDVISTINYYHVLQTTDGVLAEQAKNSALDNKTRLTNFVKSVENVKYGGMPVILLVGYLENDYNIHSLENPSAGHALVAYDIEYGRYTVDSLVGTESHTYNTRVTVYDPSNSSIKKPIYMYIDIENERWLLEGWAQNPTSSDGLCWYANEGAFNYIDNPEIFNPYYTEDVDLNYSSILTVNSLTDITVRSNGRTNLRVNGINIIEGNTRAYVIPDFNGNSDSITYLIDDYDKDYEIAPTTPGGEVDFDFEYQNVSYSVSSESCSSVNVSPNNELSANGCNGDYTINAVFNDGIVNSPWYSFTASGADCENISMSLNSDNALILEGDNLNNITFTVKNGETTFTDTITTNLNTVMIGNDENSLEFYVDTDGDGEYEKRLQKPRYEVDLKNPQNGDAEVNKEYFHAGEKVTVETTPNPGYILTGIYVDGEKISGNTFIMPNHDVKVKVEFEFSIKEFIKTPIFIIGSVGVVLISVMIPVCVISIKKKGKKKYLNK